MVPRPIARLTFLIPAIVLLALGCEHDGTDASALGPLATIEVTPDPHALNIGGTQTFVATGRDANGNEVAVSPTWSVVAGGGSINSTSAVFTAGALAGFFENTIQATSGGISGFASVSVTSGVLASITVTPDPATVGTGGPVQFTAEGADADGNAVAIPGPLVWSVETAAAGTIDAETGEFTAGATVASYTDAVRATSGSISGTATVIVAVPGALFSIIVSPDPASVATGSDQQFTAAGQDGNGTFVVIPPGLVWSVENGGGTIDAVTGVFTAGGALGDFAGTVKATSGSVSDVASVTVTASSSSGPSLGSAEEFAVLGSTAVSCVGVSTIAGSVGVAPAGDVTGFPAPCTIASPGDPVPHINDSPAVTAQADVTPAFDALAAMPCEVELTGQNLGGLTLSPGVYCFTSSAQLTGILTLAGPASGLWVFQVGTALTTGTSAQVVLSGGAVPKNVFWQVGSSATLGQTTAFQGNVIAGVSVTLVQGATLVGRALSKAGVTMDANDISLP